MPDLRLTNKNMMDAAFYEAQRDHTDEKKQFDENQDKLIESYKQSDRNQTYMELA